MNRRRVLLLVCCIMLLFSAKAETINNGKMNHLTMENGLAGESVSRIITDHNGQVWIATSDGINRFNGKKIITYTVPRRGVARNYTFDICEGRGGSIFIGTKEGIFELKKGASSFRRIYDNISNSVEAVLSVGNNLYFGNQDGLFVSLNGKTLKKITVSTSPVGLDNSVRFITKSDDGYIWFVTRYNINRLDTRTFKVKSINVTKNLNLNSGLSCLAVFKDKIFVGTKNEGLFSYSRKNSKFNKIQSVGNVITKLQACKDGNIYISCDGVGALVLNAQTEKVVEAYNVGETGKNRIPSNGVYCFYHDNNGVNWIGFYRNGLVYTYHSEPLFNTYSYKGFTTEGLDVRSFYINGTVHIIGTHQGFYYIDESRNIIRYYSPNKDDVGNIITCISYFNGYYYIGSYDKGIRKLNAKSLALTKVGNDRKLDVTTFSDATVSPDNRLWLGCGEGIFVIDAKDNVVNYTERNAQLYGGIIRKITFDGYGNAWIGTASGLTMYLSKVNTFISDKFPDGFFNKEKSLVPIIGHGDIMYLYNLTSIYYTNTAMTDFGELKLPLGLFDESCYSLVDDKSGHLWLVTEKGLFRLDYNLKEVQHFGYGEGLPSQLISSRLYIDKQNKLWIGTANGLVYVNTSDLIRWQHNEHFKVLLYNVKKDDLPVDNSEDVDINEDKSIYLKWNIVADKLSLTPILEDFARPDGRFYQYRLDDKGEWTLLKDGEEIVLNNLSIGKHVLALRLAGASGTQKSYNIYVIPSFMSWMELMLFIVAVVLYVLWSRYHSRTRALLNERNTIEEALIEEEQVRQNEELARQTQSDMVPDEISKGEKYQRVKLNDKECEIIVGKMSAYMEKSRPYLNPELKMSEVAEVLHLSASKLSQIFSIYMKENYYEYINAYRLKEFKRLIENGEYKKFTLTALSEKCGFKKSSFFSTFRKVEGLTPTEYLQKRGVKI